jgi:hypothetical protein
LYMCAGHWHEALKELVDGATRARAYSDHLWQAKALENIMVCLVLFAWSGMDFQVSWSGLDLYFVVANVNRYLKSVFLYTTSRPPSHLITHHRTAFLT